MAIVLNDPGSLHNADVFVINGRLSEIVEVAGRRSECKLAGNIERASAVDLSVVRIARVIGTLIEACAKSLPRRVRFLEIRIKHAGPQRIGSGKCDEAAAAVLTHPVEGPPADRTPNDGMRTGQELLTASEREIVRSQNVECVWNVVAEKTLLGCAAVIAVLVLFLE